MKINEIEVSDEAVLAALTDEQKTQLTAKKGETDFILYIPAMNDLYLYLDEIGEEISASCWSARQWEERLWSKGYIAPDTPEGRRYLERKRDQHLAKVRLQRWVATNSTEKIDWNNANQPKHLPIWATDEETVRTDFCYHMAANPDGIYVTSADRKRFLAECDTDLKIYFGVK